MGFQYSAGRYPFQLHRLHDILGYLLCINPVGYSRHTGHFLCLLFFSAEKIQICMALEAFEKCLRPYGYGILPKLFGALLQLPKVST